MPATMKQVAARSGLSLMTVSYVLNNKGGMFRPETCERVLQAARELNYRPNASARATRSGRFGAIALLQSSQPYRSNLPGGLLAGLQAAASEHELQLVLADLPDTKLTDDRFVPQILRQLCVDGLIVNYNAAIPERLVDLIRQHVVPAVWVNSELAEDCFRPDDAQAGRIATQRLIELGHRRIAYVDYAFGYGDDVIHYSTRDRQAGFEETMRLAGLEPRIIRPPNKLSDEHRLRESLRWLAEPDRPTAVVAYNDNTARPLLFAAATAALRIPRDLSVTTFFDDPISGVGLAFSGAMLPEREMGYQAVQTLMAKLRKAKHREPAKVLPCVWNDGATVGPPLE